MHIYLVRHTRVDVLKGTCYGQTDVPLLSSFEQEAASVLQQLQHIHSPHSYTSPLSRCKTLAHYCGFNHAQTDSRLLELNFGEWEMKQWDEIDMSLWENDWIHTPPPDGESLIEMYHRVSTFFDEICSLPSQHPTIIFTHAGVINCAKVHFGISTLQTVFDTTPPYGSIVEIETPTTQHAL